MARMMSVDLSMTITAAVPSPVFSALRLSKSIGRSLHSTGRDAGHRRAAGNDGEQIVPAAAHAAGIMVDQLAQGDAHLLLDIARLVHVAGEAEQLGAGIVGAAERGEPGGAATQNVGDDGDGLDIVDGGRRAIEPDIGGEWRLEARHALLAFEAFEQRRLLAADIGAGAVMQIEIEVPAVDVVLADQLGVIGLVDRGLQDLALADELAANIDVGRHAPAWRRRRGTRPRSEAADRGA